MFDTIDFKDCEILYCEDSVTKKEDLLLLKCKNGRLIDVGWYGQNSKYCIIVVKDKQWYDPCYRINEQPKIEYIEHYLQKVINFETAVFKPEALEILNKITSVIDGWTAFKGEFNDLVQALDQLRDMGFHQNEIANYIEIYSLKYIDSNEEKYSIACNILDQIVGFCSPDSHIWSNR